MRQTHPVSAGESKRAVSVRQSLASRSGKNRLDTEAGQTLAEYALVLALFSVVTIGTVRLFELGFGGLEGGFIQTLVTLAG